MLSTSLTSSARGTLGHTYTMGSKGLNEKPQQSMSLAVYKHAFKYIAESGLSLFAVLIPVQEKSTLHSPLCIEEISCP